VEGIDIGKAREFGDGQARGVGGGEGSGMGVLGAPRDVLEESGPVGAGGDEVIAAVVGRAEDDIAGIEGAPATGEHGRREGRTVGTDGTDARVAVGEGGGERALQAGAEIAGGLGAEVRRGKPGGGGQGKNPVDGGVAGLRGIKADPEVGPEPAEIGHNPGDESAIRVGRSLVTKRGGEAGFDPSRGRELEEEEEDAAGQNIRILRIQDFQIIIECSE